MDAKILLVDDEPNILKALRRTLYREGYTILTAADGEEALAVLAEHEVALIVCDQMMPRMSGAEVLREARLRQPTAERMALTGYADLDTVLACINEGHARQFLLKPWDDEALRAAVHEAVKAYQVRADNQQMQRTIDEQNRQLVELNTALGQKVDLQQVELRLNEDLINESRKGFQEVLARILELHEPGLRGHSRRVAHMSRHLATEAGCSPEQTDAIEAGGLLHDIGKLSLPGHLSQTSKPDLGSQEREKLEQHPLTGHALLKVMPGLDEVAKMVRHHHESISGKGYPDGLADEAIPLGARIIAVANLYDHYRYPPGKAVISGKGRAARLLRMAAGKRLDKRLVDIFLDKEIPAYTADGTHEIEISVDHIQAGMVLSRDVLNSIGKALLREGAVFTEKTIEQLRDNAGLDSVVSRIFVIRDSVPELAEEPAALVESGEDVTEEIVKPLVIIVDDEQHVVNALTRELRRAGYQVEAFTRPLDAIQQLRLETDVHALITDFNMPGVRGDRFIMQAQKERPGLPCIVITGFASRDTVVLLGKSARITRILPKPWSRDELLKTLANLPNTKKSDNS